jgi:hypothetical protein
MPILDDNTVDASPTKDFFIYMLVKDIELIDAIADLVDNCVDGARRSRDDGDFKDLWVRLTLSSERFAIDDNCGGMSVETARKYAFKFGRPAGIQDIAHTIGQFGVGMKRALFKMGKSFKVESTTNESHFVLEDTIERWRDHPDDWTFQFRERIEDPNNVPKKERGTTITVESLYTPVAADLASDRFITRVCNTLSSAHQDAISKGLSITVNGIPLSAYALMLRQSEDLRSGYKNLSYGEGEEIVQIKLYVGINDPNPSEAGWYIFCNGRLILEADQSNVTGWKEAEQDNDDVPTPQ